MANPKKAVVAPAQEEVVTPAPVPQVTYRDKRYSSRVLILPGDRQLAVARHLVAVPADDEMARKYLASHPDMQLQE